MAGRGGRSARRAPRLPAGLGPRARARRLRPREPGAPQPRSRAAEAPGAARAGPLPARQRRAPRRSASASPPPGSRPRRPKTLRGAAGIEALDALGTLRRPAGAARLGRRRARARRREAALAAHLDVAARYGVAFASFERDGRDADLLRRRSVPPRPRAARRPAAAAGARRAGADAAGCIDPALPRAERAAPRRLARRACSTASTRRGCRRYLKNRVAMRRASRVERASPSSARAGGDGAGGSGSGASARWPSSPASTRRELTDDDRRGATTTPRCASTPRAGRPRRRRRRRVGARRRASPPRRASRARPACCSSTRRTTGDAPLAQPLHLRRRLDRVGDASTARATRSRSRCSRWRRGASSGSSARAPTAGASSVLPPATQRARASATPSSPAGCRAASRCWSRARRAATGSYQRSFELVRLDGLGTERQSADPASLGAFQRWQDAGWKRATVSLR